VWNIIYRGYGKMGYVLVQVLWVLYAGRVTYLPNWVKHELAVDKQLIGVLPLMGQ
jgi:hypothetical protein